jgi:hypothetical protein
MPFTGSYVCTSFYTDLLGGNINITSNTIKLALYTNAATLNAATTGYTTVGEVAAGGGYSTKGAIVNATVTTTNTTNGPVVILDFADAVWTTPTFTARGGLLYDETAGGDPAIAVIDFGLDITGNGINDFTVSFPPPTANAGFLVTKTVLNNP